MIPQIIVLVLMFISVLVYANQHGKRMTGTYNFWFNLLNTAITFSLLWWGGFWSVFK